MPLLIKRFFIGCSKRGFNKPARLTIAIFINVGIKVYVRVKVMACWRTNISGSINPGKIVT
jgi:hypothetical protein